MVSTLTTAAKDWLAINAGIGNCFSATGITFTDSSGVSHTGGTGDVVNAFFVAHLVGQDSGIIIANTNYTSFKAINGEIDIVMDDVGFAYNNDGTPSGESKYCKSVSCTPSWQCRTPLDGYEHDINNCGLSDRLNSRCNAVCTPNWQCRLPLDGYEHDVNNCGQQDRLNSACNASSQKYACIGGVCTPNSAGTFNEPSCGGTCSPASGCPNCDTVKNLCILGQCIPKNYVLYGGIGVILLMALK